MTKFARVVFEVPWEDDVDQEEMLELMEAQIGAFISNPWGIDSVEIHSRPYEIDIKTTEKYWDCECKENYIHSKEQKVCFNCGAIVDNQPDSRIDEVIKCGFPL